MPASAGRVKMPHNNRMHTSATLKTHGIWKTMGYDPYAGDEEKEAEEDQGNLHEQSQMLMELAKMSKLVSQSASALQYPYSNDAFFMCLLGK